MSNVLQKDPMETKESQEKRNYIEEIYTQLQKEIPREHHQGLHYFLTFFFKKLTFERLARLTVAEHTHMMQRFWKLFSTRKPKESKTQMYFWDSESEGFSSPNRLVIDMVNEDRSFIVDSLLGLLKRHGLKPHQLHHPVLKVHRDKDGAFQEFGDRNDKGPMESIVHCEIIGDISQETMDLIQKDLPTVLSDGVLATRDWQALSAKIDDARKDLTAEVARKVTQEDLEEYDYFLSWLQKDHFTFLGYGYYSFFDDKGKLLEKPTVSQTLGILETPERQDLDVLFRGIYYSNATRRMLFNTQPFLISKTSCRSNVHRAVPMDAIGVKRYDRQGHVVGVHLFLGLFTSITYDNSARDIPYLRRLIKAALKGLGISPLCHDGKALVHIFDSLPRDELFQTPISQLMDIGTSLLDLNERPRTALFIRQDIFNRYLSCLVYIPSDRFDSQLMETVGAELSTALGGELSLQKAQFGSFDFARIHYIITLPQQKSVDYDVYALEERLNYLTRSWKEDLKAHLQGTLKASRFKLLFDKYANAFSRSYQENFSGETVFEDILKCEEVYEKKQYTTYLSLNQGASDRLMFKLYHPEKPMILSRILPVLENLGFCVMCEVPYEVQPYKADYPLWIHHFTLSYDGICEDTVLNWRQAFMDTIAKIRDGVVEDDGYNRLVLHAQLTARQAAWVRACGKYLRQVAIPYGNETMQNALIHHPKIVQSIVQLFEKKMNPNSCQLDESLDEHILQQLEQVQRPDEDRILRRYLNLVHATVRTNYFQSIEGDDPKPYLVLKFDGRVLHDIPLPAPMFEIYVYSPSVEAVHLRGGKVARGGIRWSDREDFRTEILGLMKAQMVKNTVIVPVGSKGGFLPKTITPSMTREEVQEHGIKAYETMIQGLLDVTDNLEKEALIPAKTVRWDEDDPYLVVAADKGTATFSDYSNAISQKNNFWLDDAFASGGSAGYDHKKMGITARGAWESVKHHFYQLDINPEKDPITVIGVGDMSGDVFGNGMLLSRSMKLVAAFNHLHIFIDPNPDGEKSFEERQRLFNLPRSSWKDYDPAVLSKGGAIFDRQAKKVTLTPEIQELLGVSKDQLRPEELLKMLLTLSVDLLWFGGIGTFIKSTNESHLDVGDRNNDAVRVNGKDVKARVIAEGANLGVTHLGRIEYAQHTQGRLNTDAIDNSAGVDCSDHEVNIKILLRRVMETGSMDRQERDKLLTSMTQDVSMLVLKDNYLQNLCISMMEARGTGALDGHIRLMRDLEKRGLLNRALEFLPDDVTLMEMQSSQSILTRPELSVVMAYAKLFIYEELLGSTLLKDSYLDRVLKKYFPLVLQKKYPEDICHHPLRQEIVATAITNEVVNRMGASFVHDLMEKTGGSVEKIVKCYLICTRVLKVPQVWGELRDYDTLLPASKMMDVYLNLDALLKHSILWLIRKVPVDEDLDSLIERFDVGISFFLRDLTNCLDETAMKRYEERISYYNSLGLEHGFSERIAILEMATESPDILLISDRSRVPVLQVTRLFYLAETRLDIAHLRDHLKNFKARNTWARQALWGLLEDLDSVQTAVTMALVRYGKTENLLEHRSPQDIFERWLQANEEKLHRYDRLLSEVKSWGLTGDIMVFVSLIREMRMVFCDR